jgi:hypothetical protein
MERMGVPPILRTRSAISSAIPKIWSPVQGRFSTWMGLPTGQWIVMSGPELIPIDRW